MDAPTVLGPGSDLDGTLSVEGTLQIEGKFTGTIRTSGAVLIGQGARVKADITAATVLIEGTVEGVVRASTLIELRPTARVNGTLATPSLAIARGAVFAGSSEMKADPMPLHALRPAASAEQRPI